MAKWVTFYEDILSGVHDLVVHDSKEDATTYFRSHYRQYFQLSSRIEIKLPMSYGYPMRKYRGMSKYMFEKNYGQIGAEKI